VERAEELDFNPGLTGDDSREGIGEFVAEVALFCWGFFVVAMDESRTGLDAEEVWSVLLEVKVVSIGSTICCVAADMEVKGLSSIVAVLSGLEEVERRSYDKVAGEV
jgi:hypothetical protein